MNPTIAFPPRAPELKLSRPAAPSPEIWAATLAEERRRLQEDHDALRLREDNLRQYESRLRALQEEIDSRGTSVPAARSTGRTASPLPSRPVTKAPFVENDAALAAGWEKLHRARALLEAEQSHLRDERIITHEKENEMKRRERAVADREARVSERERLLVEAMAPTHSPQPIASEHTMSAMTRLTRAPFDMARSVFSGKK